MLQNPLLQLHEQGQSFWYDSLSRDMIANGDLKKMVEEDGLRGITSNPTIFHQAISLSNLYDETIRIEAHKGKAKEEIFDIIAQKDIRDACDILRPIYDTSDGRDGYVSLEENPQIAHDKDASISEGYRLNDLVNRPNLLVKVPATPAGIAATKELLTNGVSVNNTLMFSLDNYDAVAETYVSALEERNDRGLPLDRVASVASMFVSRIDSKIDELIKQTLASEQNNEKRTILQKLLGKIAIANGKQCYLRYKQHFQNPRFEILAQKGARTQRILTASTSTKDPNYPDTYYVDALIGPNTVVTMAPATVPAFRDHGTARNTIDEGSTEAIEYFDMAKKAGIDLEKIMQELQDEGVDKFVASYKELLEAIEEKRRQAVIVA